MPRFVLALTLFAALLLPATISAQRFPPHKFFGSPESPALVNGAPAANGTVVVAVNQAGERVGRGVVQDGVWAIEVDSESARRVYFAVGGGVASETYEVRSGGFTAVPLNATVKVTASTEFRPGWEQYTVQSGDTLLLIGERYGLTLDALLENNPQISNPHNIQVGDVLYLRELSPAPEPAADPAPPPAAPTIVLPENGLVVPPPAPQVGSEPTAEPSGGGSPPIIPVVGGLAVLALLVGAWKWRSSRGPAPAGDPAVLVAPVVGPDEPPSLLAPSIDEEPIYRVPAAGLAAAMPVPNGMGTEISAMRAAAGQSDETEEPIYHASTTGRPAARREEGPEIVQSAEDDEPIFHVRATGIAAGIGAVVEDPDGEASEPIGQPAAEATAQPASAEPSEKPSPVRIHPVPAWGIAAVEGPLAPAEARETEPEAAESNDAESDTNVDDEPASKAS